MKSQTTNTSHKEGPRLALIETNVSLADLSAATVTNEECKHDLMFIAQMASSYSEYSHRRGLIQALLKHFDTPLSARDSNNEAVHCNGKYLDLMRYTWEEFIASTSCPKAVGVNVNSVCIGPFLLQGFTVASRANLRLVSRHGGET